MPQETGTEVPNRRYGRRQQPAQGQFPCGPADSQGGGVAQPKVPAADPEAQLQPGKDQSRQKQQVRQMGMPPSQGLYQVPQKAQAQAQQRSGTEPGGGYRRGGHPSSRRSQPPGFRGSS